MVLATCAVGIWYSLTAPSQTLSISHAGAGSDAAAKAVIEALIPQVTPAMHEYSRIRYAVHFIWIALEAAFLWAFLQLGWSGDLRAFATAKTKSTFFQLAIFLILFSAAMSFVLSPFSYATGFWLKHHYGLSNQSLLDWSIDWCKAFIVNFCIELPIWWLIYKALTKFPKRWPYLVFVGSVPIIFALTFMAPLVIDPVFNKIEAMPESSLRSSIQHLSVAAGIGDAPIFTCDRHKQTNEINAYVTGLGSSARIVLWDTTLQKLPPEEVLCVVAHEIGHYVLKHVYWGCAIAVLVSLLLVPVNIWITPSIFLSAPASWKIGSIKDIAGVPLLLLCVSIVGFVSEPLVNGYSRGVEHEADLFGLKLSGNRPAFARTFASLSRDNLAEPNPPKFIELWLYSHPSLGSRIKSALTD
jgi:STE24 endopeptidase